MLLLPALESETKFARFLSLQCREQIRSALKGNKA
jgi:hypothetical protein